MPESPDFDWRNMATWPPWGFTVLLIVSVGAGVAVVLIAGWTRG